MKKKVYFCISKTKIMKTHSLLKTILMATSAALLFTMTVACEKTDNSDILAFYFTSEGQNHVLKPYIQWGASLDKVNKYMQTNYPDYGIPTTARRNATCICRPTANSKSAYC